MTCFGRVRRVLSCCPVVLAARGLTPTYSTALHGSGADKLRIDKSQGPIDALGCASVRLGTTLCDGSRLDCITHGDGRSPSCSTAQSPSAHTRERRILLVGGTCSFWSDIFSSLSCGSSVQREETPPSLPGFLLSRRPCALMWSTKIEGSNGGITCAGDAAREPIIRKHGYVRNVQCVV